MSISQWSSALKGTNGRICAPLELRDQTECDYWVWLLRGGATHVGWYYIRSHQHHGDEKGDEQPEKEDALLVSQLEKFKSICFRSWINFVYQSLVLEEFISGGFSEDINNHRR